MRPKRQKRHNYATGRVKAQAFTATRWQRFLYEQRVEIPNSEIQKARNKLGRRLADVGMHDGKVRDCRNEADLFAGEVYSRLYDSPEALTSATVEWAGVAHDALETTTEFKSLSEQVDGDPDMAAIATAKIVDKVSDMAEKLANGMPDNSPVDIEDVARSAMRQACREATGDVAEAIGLLGGLAPGLAAAPPAHEQHDPRRMRLAQMLIDNEELRNILRLVGKFTRIATSTRKKRGDNVREEVVDIERGNDLARALPVELAKLRHPKLRTLFFKNYIERSLVQYQLGGKEPVGRGAMVCLLDESGSMHGEPSQWARAVGIAMTLIGNKENRAVTVMGFDTRVKTAFRLDEKGRAWSMNPHTLEVKSEIGDVTDMILAISEQGCGGGTSFDGPVTAAIDFTQMPGGDADADFVLVTDGHASLSDHVAERIQTLREEKGLRVFGITINGGEVTRAVKRLCDETTDIAMHGIDSVGATLP